MRPLAALGLVIALGLIAAFGFVEGMHSGFVTTEQSGGDITPVVVLPQCQEDEVLIGQGDFEQGRWTRYVCGPAVDDFPSPHAIIPTIPGTSVPLLPVPPGAMSMGFDKNPRESLVTAWYCLPGSGEAQCVTMEWSDGQWVPYVEPADAQ